MNATYGITGNHGYYSTIEVPETGTQEVYIYAINVGNGENKLLGQRTVTIEENHDPIGLIDSVEGGKGTITVKGSAYGSGRCD